MLRKKRERKKQRKIFVRQRRNKNSETSWSRMITGRMLTLKKQIRKMLRQPLKLRQIPKQHRKDLQLKYQYQYTGEPP